MSSSNIVVRMISAIWRGADGLRKVLHLFLMVFLFLMFFGALSGDAPQLMPQRAALFLQPVGALVEQVAGDPYDLALAELTQNAVPQTLVSDIVEALQHAADDDRIEIVHLELSAMGGAGLSKLQRIADAMARFQRLETGVNDRRLLGEGESGPLQERERGQLGSVDLGHCRSTQIGCLFSRNALIPSWASSRAALAAMIGSVIS